MFYLMKMGFLYNRLSTSLIMLRVFGKELFDSIKHYLIIPKTDNVWNKFSNCMLILKQINFSEKIIE